MQQIIDSTIIETVPDRVVNDSVTYPESISHSVLSKIPYKIAVEHVVIPIGYDQKGRLEILIDKLDASTIQTIQMFVGTPIKPKTCPRESILKLIGQYYGDQIEKHRNDDNSITKKQIQNHAHDSAITIVDNIVHEAVRLRASDIHLEPFEREMAVRFRIDGVLQEMAAVPKERINEIVSRVKIMAKMDIAEKRRPQDGRIRISRQGHDIDIRVSTLPTDFGEKVVLRILDKSGFDYNLEAIGMDPTRLAQFKRAVQLPNGIVLITGPTGSGKTTSLYGVMNFIRRPGVNISTVEDPIEYNIAGVNQTHVNPAIGMTFAQSLRTLLRQDPDIIMVGEMRDQETAEIAIRSSLTGHLVLSTLHTNDAPSAITRLVDMGIEPYLVSSSVTMIVAQRLVRKICTHCKCETNVPAEMKKSVGLQAHTVLYKGLGCLACGHTGYRGRTGIFEVLPMSESIRALINQKAYVSEIRDAALKDGMVQLREHALSKLTDGITTIEEVLREVAF